MIIILKEYNSYIKAFEAFDLTELYEKQQCWRAST
jgi:hypothetical protein